MNHDLSGITGAVRSEELPLLLLAALEQTRSPACITTADLDRPGPTIVYVNPAYCRMTGRDREIVIGSTPRIMQGPLSDRAELDRLRSELEAGRPFEGETVNYRIDGAPFIINWRIDHVRNTAGETTHYVATQEDVTHRRRTDRLLAAEQRLDDALTDALTAPNGAIGSLGPLVEAIAAGAQSIATMGSASVLVSVDEHAHRFPLHRDISGGRSVGFPFTRPQTRLSGMLEIEGLSPAEEAFLDRDGLTRFANRASVVLAAFVEYERQRSTALRLQSDLLPTDALWAPGFEIVTEYLPGAFDVPVGGDWYDVAVSANFVVFSVGDVSGNGVDAAALMGRLRLLASVEFARETSGEAVLAVLDGICAAEGRMATMIVVQAHRPTGRLVVWSAGHLPPFVMRGSDATALDLQPAPPLGFMSGHDPTATELVLDPGHRLLLYTDGLIERRDESLDIGLDRLGRSLGVDIGLAGMVKGLTDGLPDRVEDDIAILAIRRIGEDTESAS